MFFCPVVFVSVLSIHHLGAFVKRFSPNWIKFV
nr:MAG TPA: hypothetical protein [Caudoviricetes sp.]